MAFLFLRFRFLPLGGRWESEEGTNSMEDSTLPSREELHWKHVARDQQLRQVRKQIKRNRKPDRVRHRDWVPEGFTDLRELDELEIEERYDSQPTERVMPRGERERRRSILQRTMQQPVDAAPELQTEPADPRGTLGMVMEVSSSLCRVDLGERELTCGLRGALSAEDTGYTNVVAVGDQVLVTESAPNQGVVQAVLPRRSVLARPDVYDTHLRQVIVANAEQLLIVAAWREPAIWLELIDRYLITAERNGLQAIVCVNKTDLATDHKEIEQTLQPYLELGYRVLLASALNGAGISELRAALRSKSTVLAGPSGVGKSSLLHAVQPSLELRTGAVSERHHAGKHTTTQVSLWRLEIGGIVIDTPGIREFGLSGLRKAELAQHYPEIAALSLDCRFANCTHTDEPNCAVRSAVGQGIVSKARYHNYRKILGELQD